jgi:signal transduction histidine kinase
MRKSLRGRLLGATAAVVLAAVGAVGFLASRATHYEFRRVETFRVVGKGDPPLLERRVLESGAGQAPEAPSGPSVDRWIVAAVVGVGLASLAAVALLTRRILGPVEALTRAARQLESGDLAARVSEERADEIGELARAFNRMANALRRNEETRRNMVGDVAHELRTPLTNLRAQIEAIQDGLAPSDDRAVASLHEETMLLAGLVDDLQDLALADAGELRMSFAGVSIRDSIDRAVKAYAARAEAKNIGLATVVPAFLPPVRADEKRLGQVLRNLLENALTHTGQGGMISISISASADAAGARVTVADTGEGIPAEDLPRVFERFYRTDRSRSRETGGAGLGLSIVRQLVLAHGGDVSIDSTPGRGTSVSFSLPFIENS